MKDLARAVELTERIRGALAEEVDRARDQRVLIRKMDADGLFARAQMRAEFNAKLSEMEDELARTLASAGSAMGIDEVTFDSLRVHAPAETRALSDTFGQVRALAGALHELDILNRNLAERALGVVRGYVNAVTGSSSVYDRRGASAAGASPLSTAVRVA